MSVDDRDWYVDDVRKKSGYVERAAFRINLGQAKRIAERRRRLSDWVRFWLSALSFVIAICLFVYVVRFLLR